MAAKKRTKAKPVVASECCAVPMGEYKPCLYLNLEGQDVKQVKGLTVGEEVEVLVRGKIIGLEQRERTDHEGKSKTSGEIKMEGYRVQVLEDDNEFSKLADDDED